MPKISVAVATFNEENNIKNMLKSVKGLAWEIVAVDGNSKDKTVSILKSFGAKVEIEDNPLNFHINKNKAIRKCKGDWVLQLDADEVISPELKKEILNVVKLYTGKAENLSTVNGYWIPRKNFFLGRFLTKGGQYPDYTLRLYRNGFGLLPAKSVHEQAVVKGDTAYLKSPLLHFPYPDFSHYLKHFTLYTDIFAADFKRDKIQISFISIISYLLLKPISWFLLTYFRHKGFYDGYPGFIFSLFSALRFPVSYIKYWRSKK